MSIIVAFLIFTFIVFIHELGHYSFARLNGIGVEEFAIGMGPKLFGFRKSGTLWSFRLLPIGGFCKIIGEDGEPIESAAEAATQETQEANQEETPKTVPNGVAFYERSVWARISVIFGGPLFNFILALLFSFIYLSISGISSTTVDDFIRAEQMPVNPAEQAGVQIGDEIVRINGHRILRPMEATLFVNVEKGKPIEMVVNRKAEDGTKRQLTFSITPFEFSQGNESSYYLGIQFGRVDKNLLNVLKYGAIECFSWIKIAFYSLSMLITGKVSMSALSGPVGLVSAISSNYQQSLAEGIKMVLKNISFWIILISANLGFMNLLPIPALDGGRLVFLFGEAIIGKPIAPEKEGLIHMIGFALLMVLMVFVLYNDIIRLFS